MGAARKPKCFVATVCVYTTDSGAVTQPRIIEAKNEGEVFKHLVRTGAIDIHEATPTELNDLGRQQVAIERPGGDEQAF